MSGASVTARRPSISVESWSLCWCDEWRTCRTTSTAAARPFSGGSTSVRAGSAASDPASLPAASPLSRIRSLWFPLLPIDGLREVAANLAVRGRKAAPEEAVERLDSGLTVPRMRGRAEGEEPACVLERPADRLRLLVSDDERDVVARVAAPETGAFR